MLNLFLKRLSKSKDFFVFEIRHLGKFQSAATISISTTDWTNKTATMNIGRTLFEAGVRGVLRYKPEVFTALGIYFKNSYQITPVVYELRG
jgi:hypothetical protein